MVSENRILVLQGVLQYVESQRKILKENNLLTEMAENQFKLFHNKVVMKIVIVFFEGQE